MNRGFRARARGRGSEVFLLLGYWYCGIMGFEGGARTWTCVTREGREWREWNRGWAHGGSPLGILSGGTISVLGV